jgi:hypothetical protein
MFFFRFCKKLNRPLLYLRLSKTKYTYTVYYNMAYYIGYTFDQKVVLTTFNDK